MNLRRVMSSACLALTCAASCAPALAHPHVWIEMRSDVVFNDQGLITAVNLMWTFDDGYAQMALDGLDANGDGDYAPSELEPLTRENMESLRDYDYFTVIRFNGEKQALGPATDAGQIYSNGKLQLHMQVPLATPLDPTKGAFVAKVYDPDFFIAFDYAGDEPVTVLGAMPQACTLVVKPVPTDAELEQTRAMLATKGRDWKPENEEDFGALFAQPVTVQCST
ncbi:DUF1007 family protein [Aestuariivirga sp.]|jgi:ABC-type uncharacterized transport system substrate-binding protein|uniref:DUF1007 family protein n=1 Tax=Aestuariivirga sp. TaxID=2650926 RepID=UPI003784ED43